ncbi:MAG: hypothetical protein ABIH18_10155 [Candidatus Omnitrophota bacterium]
MNTKWYYANLKILVLVFFIGLLFTNQKLSLAQANNKNSSVGEVPLEQASAVNVAVENQPARESNSQHSENVTLDFNQADIRNVLKIISLKAGVNIVTTPDVIGNVTIRLVDVPWEMALDVILKTYGFGYEKQGNVILVTNMENISKFQSEEPLRTEIFNLKFLDAQDAERALIPMISQRGRISILYSRGQKGWQFGTFKIGKEQTTAGQLSAVDSSSDMRTETVSVERTPEGRAISNKVEFEPSVKSKTLIVTDTASSLDRIKNFIKEIDIMPKQILIETKIMEVSKDRLKDIGFDWGTGTAGASNYDVPPGDIYLDVKDYKTIAGRNLASEFTPSLFNPPEGTTTFTGTYPYRAGMEMIFKKLTGDQFEVIIHALDQDAHTNTLSSPRIVTLDNQEASILVGYHTPILTSSVTAASTSTGPTQIQTLDYYQEIGIRLNVVPQVGENNYVNMLIHPSVTSSNSSVTATNVAGTGADAITSVINYPIIDVREAQTQVIMKDGETVVIGGLISDVKGKETIGIPFISKIPLLGDLFKRDINTVSKVDLLIFITAHIIQEDDFNSKSIAHLEDKMENKNKFKMIDRQSVKNKP